VNKAKEGTEVAGDVGKALSAIVGDVTKVTDLIDGISKASEEQAQGVDQVNTAVSQMDKVTQQNAARAEESAAAAEQLSAQANTVKGVVNELAILVSGNQTSGSTHMAGRGSNTLRSSTNRRANGAQFSSKGAKTPSEPGSLVMAGQTGGKAGSSEDFMSMDDRTDLEEF